MDSIKGLPLQSEIVVSIGTPVHDRRLSDKILAAFTHAYAEGELAVAAVLRRALEQAERCTAGSPGERRKGNALALADLWCDFVEARDAFRRVFAETGPDARQLDQARRDMMDAYKRWSSG